MKLSLWRRRFGVILALALLGGLIFGAQARAVDVGPASPITDPVQIEQLAAAAYVWGAAPQFVYRFERFNTLMTAPLNTFGGGRAAAAWNNNATNAGNASVLYVNAMLDLSGQSDRGGAKELVLTVPPSASHFYVVNLLDAFINTVGSIGMRTTPSKRAQTYLLAGPTSQYAHMSTATIHGVTYRVLPLDTNLGWLLIRIQADTLVPASNPASAATIQKRVVQRFALSTLAQFEARKHRPAYFKPGQYTPTAQQTSEAAQWQNAPTDALTFFEQLGESLKLSPLPDASTGLNGIALPSLPSWISAQYGATTNYANPSYGQAAVLAQFAPLGLTANGFAVPSNWGPAQTNALQIGFQNGAKQTAALASSAGVSAATLYWGYQNTVIGTYPNTPQGWAFRAVVVLAGGSANLPLDAVYAQINNLDGTSATQLDGNNTYKLTFTPPVTNPTTLPVVGSLPPTVNDSKGTPRGFWSIHAYQTDATQSAAPFISQASVLNTAYSSASIAVTAVNPSTDTITVKASTWGPLVASSPVLFGSAAARYGLTPRVPYYVATTPQQRTDKKTHATTYSFKLSAVWKQQLSAGNVPIQGTNGAPGPTVDLKSPGGRVKLKWGPIQPVSQLGSQQLASGKLAKNPDGSVTIWIAPKLPAGAPATNWLPTPSTSYYAGLYPGVKVPTLIEPMIRTYYPTPGSTTQASILPPPGASQGATYVFPALQKVG